MHHIFYARAESVGKNELVVAGALSGQFYTVRKFSAGYLYESRLARHLNLGFGALVSAYALPTALESVYGSHPSSYMLYTRLNLR